MKETIQALEVKVEGLQKSILELKQQQEESRQSVLLGQLVYGLEDIVRIRTAAASTQQHQRPVCLAGELRGVPSAQLESLFG
ncbi:hypothetical protein HXX76_007235 [Chlamydomonas incerta]|uniref:Uncharacterized protein n=1 Tax=Chlamydomonas incerta TaxID=51695 RepID=A0A835TA56_CHLIN|nr:hypothetical protein HXX76_007235 [Chlamydomonas incerta]|eukprot:KAG2435150.1 hypothetical protein HXX76_007235 [Chlamydomonas incerta]